MPNSAHFWLALAEIVWINLLLSGDNAVVIALACRGLPPAQRRWGIVLGTLPAVLLRVLFTLCIGSLLALPFLKILGAALLLWIAVGLIQPDAGPDTARLTNRRHSLWVAVRTIVVADAVMSLDNVVAIAAAAAGDMVLLVAGLLLSMPMIIFGSGLILGLLERWPLLVTAGAGLLGWIAGDMLLSDPVLPDWAERHRQVLETVLPALGAALVVATGHLWAAQRRRVAAVQADGGEA
ncbi:MAG: TerC family protein [Geminicoccaceae bacterium]